MIFPDEKSKKMFEDGQAIAQIAGFEIDELIEKNELYIKETEIDKNTLKYLLSISLSILISQLMRLQIPPKLGPEVLRIAANSIELMLSNAERIKKND